MKELRTEQKVSIDFEGRKYLGRITDGPFDTVEGKRYYSVRYRQGTATVERVLSDTVITPLGKE